MSGSRSRSPPREKMDVDSPVAGSSKGELKIKGQADRATPNVDTVSALILSHYVPSLTLQLE